MAMYTACARRPGVSCRMESLSAKPDADSKDVEALVSRVRDAFDLIADNCAAAARIQKWV